jgi:transcriptional regulator with XRE-family HTH domain
MEFTPGQCRAARALIGWSQDQLANASKVAKATIANFELGKRTPYDRTLDDLLAALEAAGIEFTNGNQPGVRMKSKEAKQVESHHRYSAVLFDDQDQQTDLGPVEIAPAQNDEEAAKLGEMEAKKILQSEGRPVAYLKITDGHRGLQLIKVTT